MSDDRPRELPLTSLVRARFCESVVPLVNKNGSALDAFLTGMFSLVDAIIGRPLSELLEEIAVPPPVAEALLEKKGRLAKILHLAIVMERGAWEELTPLAAELRIDEKLLPEIYKKSIVWVNEILGVVGK